MARASEELLIPATTKKRVVVVGGGFAGLNVVKNLDHNLFQIVLFDKNNYNTFQPLLYQVATAGLEAESITRPLRKCIKGNKFFFLMLKVQSIKLESNQVTTISGNLEFDFLILANGMIPNFFGNKNVERFALPLKFLTHSLNLKSQLLQNLEHANSQRDGKIREELLNIVIVGAGPTGVELAGAFAEFRKHILERDYSAIAAREMKIFIIEGVDRVLQNMSPRASEAAKTDLEKLGIILQLGVLVNEFNGNEVLLSDGSKIKTKTLIWSAGLKPATISGLLTESTEKGRILIDGSCKVEGTNNIFAIGDIALYKSDKLPRGYPGVAQVAIQQGKYVAKLLKRMDYAKPIKPFSYVNLGTMATIGRGRAVADLPFNIFLKGWPAWFIWMVVHTLYLSGFKNKLIAFANWSWNYFTYERAERAIIRPYHNPADVEEERFITQNEL